MFKKYKNIGILRLNPENEYQDYTISHLKKGKEYHARFESFTGRKLIFNFEKSVVYKELLGLKTHLDFACGTGRWLSLPKIKKSVGVDVSSSMLDIARQRLKDVSLYNFNFRKEDKLEGETFDLITSFRFFANADPELRLDAIRYISTKLKPGGKFIFNNHRNFWSLSYIFFRFLFLGFWQAGMSHKQVVNLLENTELKIISTYSLGIVPQGEVKAIFPWFIVKYIEKFNSRFLANYHKLGYNVIYVCKKNE